MLRHRLIPFLLLHDGGLVKTQRFANPVYVGDPINTLHIFNEKEVDEIVLLDIMASRERRSPDYAAIEEYAGECFMPLTYGGGVGSVAEAAQLFRIGVEKICLQTAALGDLRLISDLAAKFGSQAVVVSVDVRRNWIGSPKLFSAASRSLRRESWLEFAQQAQAAGAGEIVMNAVDKDGTLAGPDLELVSQAAAALTVPLIALGGISSLGDVKATIDAGASAVGAGAFFVFFGPHRAVLITYPQQSELEALLK